jgi:hypothetical protein
MKQIYIAAAWHRRLETRLLAEELEDLGIYVKADWLYHDHTPRPTDVERHMREMAYVDVAGVRNCDVFVRLADSLSGVRMVPSSWATGARMFEQGLAHAWGKIIYVVGGKQMLFDRLPNVTHVRDKEHLKRELCEFIVQ